MSRRLLVLILAGAFLIAGAYPAWLAVAEREAKKERARERATDPDGKRAEAFFGKIATMSDDRDMLLMSRFAVCLEALGESSLESRKANASQECYRFTWLRSFHRPVVFRAELKNNAESRLTIKVADGAGGYELGKVIRNETQSLDKTVAEKLRARAQKILKLEPYEKWHGLDGSFWLMEVLVSGHYHVVYRWTPKEGDMQSMGQLLIEQAPASPDFAPVY